MRFILLEERGFYVVTFLRFLCGTCNISFKLDRRKKIGEDVKKTEAKNVKNVSKRRKLRSTQDVKFRL